MKAEDAKLRKEVEDGFRDQIKLLKDEMDEQAKENSEAVNTARFAVPFVRLTGHKLTCVCRELASELGRLRRLMRVAGTAPDQQPPDTDV